VKEELEFSEKGKEESIPRRSGIECPRLRKKVLEIVFYRENNRRPLVKGKKKSNSHPPPEDDQRAPRNVKVK